LSIKKSFLLLVLTLTIVLSMSLVSASQSLSVTSTTNNLESGKNATITLSLENAGTEKLYDVKIAFVELSPPLNNDKLCDECRTMINGVCTEYEDSCFIRLNDLSASNSLTTTYRVQVPTDAEEGLYLAGFVIKYTVNKDTLLEKTYTINKVISLNVTSGDRPRIIIKNVKLPETVNIGDDFWLNFTIRNPKSKSLKDVIIRLEGTDLGNTITIINNTNEILTTSLKPNEERSVSVKLRTTPSTSVGAHTIEIKVNYTTYDNQEYSSSFDASFIAKGDDGFAVFLQEVNPKTLLPNELGEISVGVANTGTSKVESVKIKFLPSQDYLLNNVVESYVGNLDVGDYTTASFQIIPLTNGTIPLSFEISYTNALNKARVINKTLTITIAEQHFLQVWKTKTSFNPVDYLSVGIILLVLVFLSYYFIKSRRKKT